jgi:D-glycero-alpha-D-manno-heptose-7-phosphate kinase
MKKWFEPTIRIAYSKTEIVDSVDQIEHPVVRESLRYHKLKSHIEIAVMADLPAGTGMGSSGSFAVGLLNVLSAFKGKKIKPKPLAELAFNLQHDTLKEAGGKQDQYAASFGGIISMKIQKDGNVTVNRLKIKPKIISALEERLICFYTGIKRSAPQIQNKYCDAIKQEEETVIESLHKIRKNSDLMISCLEKDKISDIGYLFEEHWIAKKNLSNEISNDKIDRYHDEAIKAGALGGKMLGAGGGGYMVFLCKEDKKQAVKRRLNHMGMTDVPLRLSQIGSTTYNQM